MAKRNLATAGGSTPPTKKDKSGELCVSCNKGISDSSHSLFCESCFEWEHRSCSGVSPEAYDVLSKDPCSNIMFFCTNCRPRVTQVLKFFNEIQEKHVQLEERLKHLETRLARPTSIDDTSVSVSTGKSADVGSGSSQGISNQSAHPQDTVIPKPPQMISDRKFNVIIYGIRESPPNTPRAARINSDLDNLQDALSNIDKSLNTTSIQDFHRLGKFNATNPKPRPLLVKFLRVFDATLVLSKRGSLQSPIHIKPDLTRDERAVDSAFLKVRWNLIQTGTDKKCIKLRGNNIYINKLLYARLTKANDGSIETNIVNNNLSNSQLSDSIQLVSTPTLHQHSPSSNPEPMITTASSADSSQSTAQAKSDK